MQEPESAMPTPGRSHLRHVRDEARICQMSSFERPDRIPRYDRRPSPRFLVCAYDHHQHRAPFSAEPHALK